LVIPGFRIGLAPFAELMEWFGDRGLSFMAVKALDTSTRAVSVELAVHRIRYAMSLLRDDEEIIPVGHSMGAVAVARISNERIPGRAFFGPPLEYLSLRMRVNFAYARRLASWPEAMTWPELDYVARRFTAETGEEYDRARVRHEAATLAAFAASLPLFRPELIPGPVHTIFGRHDSRFPVVDAVRESRWTTGAGGRHTLQLIESGHSPSTESIDELGSALVHYAGTLPPALARTGGRHRTTLPARRPSHRPGGLPTRTEA
jgi:pimeloyl-ACP methyl ester carboxylesterase